jgi:predicted DNA-binding transcriptional regulator AlpA
MDEVKQPTNSDRRAYRINEAARAYGLSRSTLYKLMTSGALQNVKIDAIEALLTGGEK